MNNNNHKKIESPINRRTFIKASIAAAVAAPLQPILSQGHQQNIKKSMILRVHNDRATKPWNYEANAPWDHTVEPNPGKGYAGKIKERYFDCINDSVVADMLEKGLQEFTETASVKDAWKKLLPGFSSSCKITIKVNVNNATFNPQVTNNRMDQTMPLINAVLEHLVEILEIPEDRITLLDAKRWFHPVIMKGRCKYKNVHWMDHRYKDMWDHGESVVFSKDDPAPGGDFWMPKAYTKADHIINLCLMKNHGCGITGAMKNHFGSIPSPRCLHDGLGDKSYIADLCNTPSIRNKVRINIVDALFANWHNNVWAPRPWLTFPEPSPNSLLFGTDPVALDSVMLDHIITEIKAQGDNAPQWVKDCIKHHDFLEYAMTKHKLGIHEHRPYHRIDYREIEV